MFMWSPPARGVYLIVEPKRAVLYARVSSDDRKYATSSIEGQLAECRAFALKRGYTVVREVFEDPTSHTSGAAWLPELENLLRLAPTHTFDVIVCRELDRLARSLAKQLVIEAEFERLGVELAYVMGDYPDTPEGALMKNIKAVISEYERTLITQRMVRGRRRKAMAGYVVLNGAPLYGYSYIPDGKNRTLVIDEDEARVVRQIFAWYTGDEKLGSRQIARRLSEMRIPTPADSGKGRGKGKMKTRPYATWGSTTVLGILSNETYSGVWHYSKYAEDPDQLIAVPVPAIVEVETFNLAQAQRKRNKIEAVRNVKHDYLMRRRVICGECGSAMNACYSPSKGKDFFYYKCDTPYDKGINSERECNQRKHFRADHVDDLVWEWVKSYLSDPTKLAEGLTEYQSEHERETAPLRERLAVLDKLILDNRGQLDRLLDLYLSGDFPKDALLERKARLTDTITALEQEREGLAAQLRAQSLTESEIQSVYDFAAEVAEGLSAADEDFETRRRIIELLDVRATLAIEEGERVVYPRCRFWDGRPLSIVTTNTSTYGHNPQTVWVLSARLPLLPMP